MSTISPNSTSPLDISVTRPVTEAIDRVKRVLFQPFDLGKWFIIGFTAWLAQLGESGGAHFNSPGGGGHGKGHVDIQHELERAWDYTVNNLYWIVPVAAGVVLICIGLWLLVTWLSSRGKFMFLHCVALDKAEVGVPWRKFAREANSLFWFRIVLGLSGAVVMLPLAGVGVFMGVNMVKHGAAQAAGILGLVGVGFVFMALAFGFFLIAKLTKDFVVPIMFLHGCRCLEGWAILRGLLSANLANFLLYLLFQIVIALVTGLLVLVVAIVTCCFCCLLLMPYLGTVILLPVLMFKRAYSLHYLAQYGREYDVFPAAA